MLFFPCRYISPIAALSLGCQRADAAGAASQTLRHPAARASAIISEFGGRSASESVMECSKRVAFWLVWFDMLLHECALFGHYFGFGLTASHNHEGNFNLLYSL